MEKQKDLTFISRDDGTRWVITDLSRDAVGALYTITSARTGATQQVTEGILDVRFELEDASAPLVVEPLGKNEIKVRLSRVATYLHNTSRLWDRRDATVNRARIDNTIAALVELRGKL